MLLHRLSRLQFIPISNGRSAERREAKMTVANIIVLFIVGSFCLFSLFAVVWGWVQSWRETYRAAPNLILPKDKPSWRYKPTDDKKGRSRMTFKNTGSIVAKLIAGGMLVGALGHHQYGYYTLLRWIVCSVSAFAAYQAAESNKSGWAWGLAIVALAFNPVIPVHLKRETWAFIDLAVAGLLIVSIATLDRHTPQS